ncbi:MAG TPA: PAS domain S-box protein [Acidimicrobiia bacterium]|jgi:diguanylate cyclase (GGDEF)-like protein/PAS domain S-box-containing protein
MTHDPAPPPSARRHAVPARQVEQHEAEERFRALVAHSPDIITVLEPDGSWRSSSAAGTRLLGYEEGFDPEGGIFGLLHPDDVEPAMQAFQQVLDGTHTGEPLVFRVRTADGNRWVHLETVARNLVEDPAVRGIVLNSRDVTDRVRAEQRFAALVEHATDVITLVVLDDDAPRVEWASPSIEAVLGYAPDELVGTDPLQLIHPDDVAEMFEASARAVESGEPALVEYRAVAKDGSIRFFEAVTSDLSDESSVGGFVTNARDITDRRHAEQEARQLTEVLEQSNEIVVLSETSGAVVYANQRAREFLGLGAHHNVAELTSIESREQLRDVIMPLVRRHGLWHGELTLRTTSGNEVPVIATVQAHREQGEIVLISTIAHDITELKAAQHRLEYEATHDTLTGLPNRAMLQEVGEQAMGRASRYGTTTALLFLDLDLFKEVNDTLGHDAGDRVLVELARRLRVGIRTGDLVARLGGDEFCVLCERVESRDEMRELGQRLCDVVSIPMVVHGREVQVGTSVGVALAEGGSETIGTLIRNADVALYRAKREGRFRIVLFDAGMVDAPSERTEPTG